MPIPSYVSVCALFVAALVSFPTNLAGQSCYQPPANMVGWWTGDKTATDFAGPDNGKLENGATYAKGYVGKAFSLNGSNQYVDVGNGQDLQVSAGDFSVDAWVKFNTVGGVDESIADKMSGGGVNTDGWRLLLQQDDLFWFCLGASGNGCQQGISTTVIGSTAAAKDAWYFVAATKTSSTISIYVNGTLEGSTSLGPFTDSNSTDLLLGSYAGASAFLDGLVDEVELFNRALAPSEIAAIFSAGKTGKCKVEVTASPSKLNFAAQAVGTTSSPKTVRLKNTTPNGAVLQIGNIAASGDFEQTNDCPATLNHGQTCSVQVTFTPTQSGKRSGDLTIDDNVLKGAEVIPLSGSGTP